MFYLKCVYFRTTNSEDGIRYFDKLVYINVIFEFVACEVDYEVFHTPFVFGLQCFVSLKISLTVQIADKAEVINITNIDTSFHVYLPDNNFSIKLYR